MNLLFYLLNDNASNAPLLYASEQPLPTIGPTSYTLPSRAALGTDNLFIGNLGGETDINMTQNFDDRLVLNGIAGTAETPIRLFMNGNEIGGDNVTAGQQVLSKVLNNSNHITTINGILRGNSNNTIAGITGTSGNPAPDGAIFKYQRVTSLDMSFANFQINFSNDPDYYELLELIDCRGSGYDVEGEILYIGDTDKADGTYSLIRNFNCVNFGGSDKGRDGLQINHCVPNSSADIGFTVRNSTFVNVGVEGVNGQGGLLQIQNSNGRVENCIFDGAHEFGNIFSHDVTIENCFFNLTRDGDPMFIGDLFTSAYGSNAEAGNLQPITFRNCVFRCAVPITTLFRVLEENCNIVFEDCTVAGTYTNFVIDDRVVTSGNSIITTNLTTTSLAAVPAPSYISTDPTNSQYLYLNSSYHHNLQMGYGTPSDVKNIAITNDTIEELNLPNAEIGEISVETNGLYSLALEGSLGDNDEFNLSGNTLRATNPLLFASGSTRDVHVRATNTDDPSFTDVFVLTINVTEFAGVAITDIDLTSTTVTEGNTNPFIIGDVTVDALANPQAAIITVDPGFGDGASFSIVNTNQLQINEVTDFATKSTYSVRISAFNGFGAPRVEDFTINVLEDRVTVLISFGRAAKTDPSVLGQTWNLAHTDNTSSYTLSNLVDTDGNNTGLELFVDSFMSATDLGVLSTPSGQTPVYPIAAYSHFWNPTTGGTRGFDLRNMDNGISYRIKTQGTVRSGSGFGNTNLLTHILEPSTGNEETLTIPNCTDDVETVLTFADLNPTAGEITFRSTDTATGTSPICIMEISYPRP